jgi:hypothetical protein
MKTLPLLLLIIFVTSCSSISEKVISRMDNVDEKPSWATLSKTMFVKEGKVFSVGLTEANAGSRVSALSRVADNNARFELSRTIIDESSFIFQNMEEGAEEGGQLSRFYGNELSKHVSHGVRQEKRYWEKIQTFDEHGDKVFRIKLFSLVSIKESDLKKAVKRALNKEQGISPKMKEAIDNHITSQIKGLEES